MRWPHPHRDVGGRVAPFFMQHTRGVTKNQRASTSYFPERKFMGVDRAVTVSGRVLKLINVTFYRDNNYVHFN